MTNMLSSHPTPSLAPLSSFNQQQLASGFIAHLGINSEVKLDQNRSKPRSLTSQPKTEKVKNKKFLKVGAKKYRRKQNGFKFKQLPIAAVVTSPTKDVAP